MSFTSIDDAAQRLGVMGELDFALAGRAYRPGLGEYLSAAAGQAFDRTFGARAWEEIAISQEELHAFAADKEQIFQTEEEYKNSDVYQEGVPFQKGMTRTRASLLAEDYKERRQRERIIAAGDENGPWWYGVLGFGAGVVGSLPDPINLIPFGGGAVTGAKLAGMTTKQVLAQSAKTGIIEGAAGNLVSSGYAAWDLNRKGEDLTAQDVLVDTMFGAVAGPLFHGAGAAIARTKARRGLVANMETMNANLPEGSPALDLNAERLASMRRGDAGAYREAADIHGTIDSTDIITWLRMTAQPQDRMEFARALEKAIMDVSEGRGVDVSFLNETVSLAKAYDSVKAEVDARTPAGEPGEVLVVLEPRGEEPMGVQRGTMAEVDGKLRAAGRIAEHQTGSRAGYGITKVIIEHPEVTRADVLSIPRIMREYEPDASHGAGRTWVVERDDGRLLVIGEAKTKDGGILATVHLVDLDKTRPLSQKKKTPKNPDARFAAYASDTAGSLTIRDGRSPRGGESIIIRDGEDVNAAIERAGGNSLPDSDSGGSALNMRHGIDWRTESPKSFEPRPEVARTKGTPFSEETVIVPEEGQITHLQKQGHLPPEDGAQGIQQGNGGDAKPGTLIETIISPPESSMRIKK